MVHCKTCIPLCWCFSNSKIEIVVAMGLFHGRIPQHVHLATPSISCFSPSISALTCRHSPVQVHSCHSHLAWSCLHWMVWAHGRWISVLLHSRNSKLCPRWSKCVCTSADWTHCLLYCAFLCPCAWNYGTSISYWQNCSHLSFFHCRISEVEWSGRGNLSKSLHVPKKYSKVIYRLDLFFSVDTCFSFILWRNQCKHFNFSSLIFTKDSDTNLVQLFVATSK